MTVSSMSSLLRPLVEAIARRLSAPRVIYDRSGKSPYLSRYYVLGGARAPDGSAPFEATGQPKSTAIFRDGINVFLHRFHRGDDDTALHNHPWRWAVSIVLVGGYSEERRRGNEVYRREVRPLSINVIRANDFHRVDLLEHDCWSLFVAGPKAGSWGFWDRVTGRYWPWREFITMIRGEGWVAS